MNSRLIPPAVRLRVAKLRKIYPIDVASRAYFEFSQNHGSIYAAAVTYYVIFSLFPLLIFTVAVFGIFVSDPQRQAQVIDEMMKQIPQALQFRSQIEDIVSNVANTQNGIAGLIGLLGLAWTASGMFRALRRALNNAFDVDARHGFVRGRALDILGVISVLLMSLLSIALSTALGVFRAVSSQYFHGFLSNLGWTVFYLLLPLAVSWFVFLATYRWVPNHSTNSRDLWIGALVAALGFELAKAGFGIYVVKFGNYAEVYGALGSVVAFMFFVFLVTNIVIFGAELSSELAKDHRARLLKR
jgi:membrane protein